MGKPAKAPVSVIILTKNEEADIGRTLMALVDFDDVVVVDSGSTDGTAEIARSFGARVVDFIWDGRYPKKKQWSLDNAKTRYDWVLLLDADEYPSEELVSELKIAARHPSDTYGAYDITLQYRFGGKFLQHGHRVTKRSFLNKTVTMFPEVDDLDAPGIREVEGHYQPQTTLRVGRLRGALMHDDTDPVASWFERHNRYSDWEAHLRLHPSKRSAIASKRSTKGQLFDRVPGKPIAFFLYSYLLRRGFLDGRAGLDYAVALSTYYWQISLKVREARRTSSGPDGQL